MCHIDGSPSDDAVLSRRTLYQLRMRAKGPKPALFTWSTDLHWHHAIHAATKIYADSATYFTPRICSIKPFSSSIEPNWIATSPMSSRLPCRLTLFLIRTSTSAINRSASSSSTRRVSQDFSLLAFCGFSENLALSFLTRLSVSRTVTYGRTVFRQSRPTTFMLVCAASRWY